MQMAGQGTLPEAVLITLLTTTTANVLASFFFVAPLPVPGRAGRGSSPAQNPAFRAE